MQVVLAGLYISSAVERLQMFYKLIRTFTLFVRLTKRNLTNDLFIYFYITNNEIYLIISLCYQTLYNHTIFEPMDSKIVYIYQLLLCNKYRAEEV